jgi:hypothetical protein
VKDDCVVARGSGGDGWVLLSVKDCRRLGLQTYMRESAAAYVARSDGAANPETNRTADRPEPGQLDKEEPERRSAYPEPADRRSAVTLAQSGDGRETMTRPLGTLMLSS